MLKKLLAFLFTSLLLLGCGHSTPKSVPVTTPSNVADGLTTPVKVAHVVDGDTIIVFDGKEKVKVRLIGIDTPESVHRDESKNTREGKIVSERLSSFLTGKRVQLEFDAESQDKYGRLLAYVWLDGEMVNKMLLDAGLAKTLSIPPNTKHADEFALAEEGARESGAGFWGKESKFFLEAKS